MARKNEGKQFEDNWKSSIPENVLYYRLKDSAQSFGFKNNENTNLRFSLKNPCDCFLFCSPYFFTIELKSTVSTSISFEREKNQKNKKMIHYHQINGLNKFSKYNFVISGFLFNFRKKDENDILYYQDIIDFENMINEITKMSFNEADLMKYNAIIVNSKKLKVNYRYDVTKFIDDAVKIRKGHRVWENLD